jgi:flagellar basal-body rod modification protein FlgD
MTNVTPTTGALSTSGTTLSTKGASLAPSTPSLGKDAFLQLMMTQLKNQDPLSPSDPTQYLSELSSFSTLEQETNIAASTSAAASQQTSSSALALLGHTVTYTDASTGKAQTGAVQKIDFTANGPTLTIGGIGGISLSSITEAS